MYANAAAIIIVAIVLGFVAKFVSLVNSISLIN